MSGINLREAMKNAEDFTVIPEQTYEAIVSKARADKTKGGNGKAVKEKVSVMFKIDGGPHDGRTVWNDFVISPESGTAMGIFGRQMAALLGDEWLDVAGTTDELAAALLDKRAAITLKIEEYPLGSGNMRNKVSGVKRSAGGASPFDAPAPAATAAPAETPTPAANAPASPF